MTLSFSDIRPFIRLAHCLEIPSSGPLPPRKAYDHRLMYVQSGQGTMILNQEKLTLHPGTLMIWGPGIAYSIHADTGDTLVMDALNFDYTQQNCHISVPVPPHDVSLFDGSAMIGQITFSDNPYLNSPVSLHHQFSIGTQTRDIILEFSGHNIFSRLRTEGLFQAMLAAISHQLMALHEPGYHQTELILRYIQDHYQEPLSGHDLAAVFAYHPTHISRLIHRHTGMTTHQYVTHCRIQAALKLMQNISLSVSEIASLCGYPDPAHFSKVFSQAMGKSPAHYMGKKRQTPLPS